MHVWTHPSDHPLELRPGQRTEEWALYNGGIVVARIAVPYEGTPTLAMDRRTWHVVPYDSGWRFAVVPEGSDDPDAWFTGTSTGLGSDRIVVAPEREYRLRSSTFGPEWRLVEGRTELARLERRKGVLSVRPRALPETPGDAALLIVLACAVAELRRRMGEVAGAGDAG